MAESHDEQTSDGSPIGIHAVEMPPLPTWSAPPTGPDLMPVAPEPEESSETDAVSPEPLDDAVDSPGGVTLAPQDDESHEDWSVKAIGGSMPIAKSLVRRLRSLILLLLAVVLSCVAIWTPKELQAVAAEAIGLILATDIAEARSEPGPNPLVGQLEVISSPSGIEMFIDDELRGVTPANLVLSAGIHHVTLVCPTGTVHHRVRIRPGQRTVYAEVIFPGTLYIASDLEVELQVGGETLTPSPDSELTLAPGSYEVDLLHPDDGRRTTHTVEIIPGRVTRFDVGRDTY